MEIIAPEQFRSMLSTAVEQSIQGIIIMDLEGTILFCNHTWASMHGYENPLELIGRSPSMFFGGDQKGNEVFPFHDRVLKNGSYRRETTNLRKDATILTTWMTVTLLKNDEGKPISFLCTAEEITEREKTEEALTKSGNIYRQMIENIDDIIFTVNLEGTIVYINPAVEHISGYKVEECLGKPFTTFVHPDDLPFILKKFELTLSGNSEPSEFRFIDRNGNILYLRTSGRPLYDRNRVVGITGVISDISSQKIAEEALKKSEEKYRTILNSIEDGYYEVDLAGNMTFFNYWVPRAYGYDPNELLGKNYRDYTDVDNAKILFKAFHEVFKTGGSSKRLECEVIRKDGSRVSHELSISLIRDSSGKPIGFRGIARDISERKRAEENLRKSEEKHRTILENMDESYFELDLRGNYTFFNNSLCRDHGYSRQELMGMNYRVYTSPDTAKRSYQIFNEIYRSGKPETILDHKIIRKDGTKRIIEMSISLMRGSSGEPIGFRGVGRDVTERIEAEQALRESREYLNTIINCIGDPVFVNDQQHRYVLVNKAFADLIGRPHNEIIGRTDIDFFPKEQVDVFWKFDDEVFETGRETTKEEFINNSHGQVLTVLTKKSLFTDKSGNRYIVGVIRDITERKNMEEALRQSENQFRSFAQTANDAIITSDSSGRIIFWNIRAERMFGYTSQEVLDKNFTMIIPERFRAFYDIEMKKMIKPVNEMGIPDSTPIGRMDEIVGLRKDRIEFPIELSFSSWNSEGKSFFTSIIRDITERKRLEDTVRRETSELKKTREDLVKAYTELQTTHAHLLQQEKMASIGQLAAGVAHEINNPMGFISSNLGTLSKYLDKRAEYMAAMEQLVDQINDKAALAELNEKRKVLKIDFIAEDIKDLIKESLEGAERVKKIVQDLKSFSRVDQAEYKHADVNECMESTINIVWNELKYKATVQKEYGEIPLTKCFPQQLNQVFMNLLVNASHAIEKQGTITAKTLREGDSIFISVSDTGRGIEPGIITRIFDPFFTTKKVGEGTGLGLSITYDIIKKHGGEITVRSEVGKGSTFTVRIPIVEEK
jgi:two-component system NtrC family sensor kinase